MGSFYGTKSQNATYSLILARGTVVEGYVCTFTNLEEVLYVYTRSRDGSHLDGMFNFLLSGELDIGNYREKRGQKPKIDTAGASLLEQAFRDTKLRARLKQCHNDTDMPPS
jgi:hypothetical protein